MTVDNSAELLLLDRQIKEKVDRLHRDHPNQMSKYEEGHNYTISGPSKGDYVNTVIGALFAAGLLTFIPWLEVLKDHGVDVSIQVNDRGDYLHEVYTYDDTMPVRWVIFFVLSVLINLYAIFSLRRKRRRFEHKFVALLNEVKGLTKTFDSQMEDLLRHRYGVDPTPEDIHSLRNSIRHPLAMKAEGTVKTFVFREHEDGRLALYDMEDLGQEYGVGQ